MVTDETRTMLSVRGDASVVVMPDQALIVGHVTAHADSKTSVVGIVNERLTAVTADLAKFGGVARSAQTSAAPLAWSATSLTTHAEQAHAKTTGENGFTGRHQATVSLNVSVRDFDLLEAVARVIAAYDNYDTHHVQWFVDEDNAGWPQVRAEAIRVALLRGRDYASALGGSVVRVEHVADAGLLNGDSMSFRGIRASGAAFGGSGEGIVLDPEPQTLTAVIEARFIATVGPLWQLDDRCHYVDGRLLGVDGRRIDGCLSVQRLMFCLLSSAPPARPDERAALAQRPSRQTIAPSWLKNLPARLLSNFGNCAPPHPSSRRDHPSGFLFS